MKKLKLNELKLTSFVAELSDEQSRNVVGGVGPTPASSYTGATSCCNPATTESTVDTCGNPAPAKCIKKKEGER